MFGIASAFVKEKKSGITQCALCLREDWAQASPITVHYSNHSTTLPLQCIQFPYPFQLWPSDKEPNKERNKNIHKEDHRRCKYNGERCSVRSFVEDQPHFQLQHNCVCFKFCKDDVCSTLVLFFIPAKTHNFFSPIEKDSVAVSRLLPAKTASDILLNIVIFLIHRNTSSWTSTCHQFCHLATAVALLEKTISLDLIGRCLGYTFYRLRVAARGLFVFTDWSHSFLCHLLALFFPLPHLLSQRDHVCLGRNWSGVPIYGWVWKMKYPLATSKMHHSWQIHVY